MSSSNPTARKGTTAEQRDAYELAIARRAAQSIREDGDSRADAIDYAFSVVDPHAYFAPAMAEALANARLNAAELARVEQRVAYLLTLGRRIAEPAPLMRRMPNGATVADWLGTARTAAACAARDLDYVRQGQTTDPAAVLERAEQYLMQALEELRAVRAEVRS